MYRIGDIVKRNPMSRNYRISDDFKGIIEAVYDKNLSVRILHGEYSSTTATYHQSKRIFMVKNDLILQSILPKIEKKFTIWF